MPDPNPANETLRPAWVSIPPPWRGTDAAAWAWAPALAVLAGSVIQLALCVGVAFWVGRVGATAGAEDAEAGRGGGGGGCGDAGGGASPAIPSRPVVAVIQPDGGACAAARED